MIEKLYHMIVATEHILIPWCQSWRWRGLIGADVQDEERSAVKLAKMHFPSNNHLTTSDQPLIRP